jgi:D-glycero-alpha-D-manno-heptose-7-phosphate kinase
MKVIRAPLRVSLFGGGTDLDPFCSEHGSTIISFAIDKYMHLIWNPRPTGGCHLSYSQVEELDTLKDAEHTLVREAARRYGIQEPCTLTIVSDLPKGTGLGSSSALAVCLTRMRIGLEVPTNWVMYAANVEQSCSCAGWQDYLPAAFGGLNIYAMGQEWEGKVSSVGFLNETLKLNVIRLSPSLAGTINRYGLLLYTGHTRPADSVLPSWQKSTEQLHQIKALADRVAGEIDTLDPKRLGDYLNLTWELKRSISGVSDPVLNRQYALAMLNGALGGKLCGAGAGGCWFFLVPPEKRERVVQALGLREVPFQIAEKGVEAWEL